MNLRVRAALAVVLSLTACARSVPRTVAPSAGRINLEELWQEPVDLATRDLFHGPGGPALMPDPSASYVFVAVDQTGYSPGYDVRGPDGTQWSVKLGLEAQPEVVSSRVLWAIGFHQPPTYYVPRWTLTGTQAGPQPAARFRADWTGHDVAGEWSWYANEFVDTQPFKGLLVANLLLNNWDWKTSNNRVYQVTVPSGGGPRRRFVVRDLGASLGKTTFPRYLNWFPMRGFGQGSRNDIDGFEEQGFVKAVNGSRVEFHYRGIHRPLLKIIAVDDVVWTCRLLLQISDAQWGDIVRAAGYPPAHGQRYVTKLKAKIAEGLALAASGPI